MNHACRNWDCREMPTRHACSDSEKLMKNEVTLISSLCIPHPHNMEVAKKRPRMARNRTVEVHDRIKIIKKDNSKKLKYDLHV